MPPESVFSADRLVEHLPSTTTFVINQAAVHSPQTGHPWYLETDHEMGSTRFYSLIPQKNENQYVSHYRVESRRPRLLGNFSFTDAWLTTRHRFFRVDDAEFHFSETLFSPERADDKLYFGRPPHRRIEIVVPDRLIEDRELLALVGRVVSTEYEIPSLLQCRP
jgi:hypothetical protein